MVDYNQALSVDEALTRGRALDREDIAWLEEPIRHDDYAGAAMLARELSVPVQIGENFSLRGRHADGAQCQGLRSGDARSRTHRRRHRLAARRGARRRAQDQDVIASLFRDQRASARGDADRAFPRIRRLGRQDLCRSRCGSSTARPSSPTGRATASSGSGRGRTLPGLIATRSANQVARFVHDEIAHPPAAVATTRSMPKSTK